ncbi:MAG: peptidylprolyl isomerase [candidate division Zixibacteria bacterium]
MSKLKGILLMFLLVAAAGAEVLDRVVAVVDKEIILLSELESQIQLYAIQNRMEIKDERQLDSLRSEFLDRMIEDKVLLVEARRDTTIEVTTKEVEEALNSQIKAIKGQFPSEDAFLEQLRTEGLTLTGLREQYRDEIHKQLLKEKLIQSKIARILVSTGDVKNFYKENIDDLPEKPAGINLSHILISIQPGDSTVDSLYNYAQLIRGKLSGGEDFALLAKNYSDDPSGENGGDLGWFARGEMVPEFESAAFGLQLGQVSEVVRSKFGFHIIKATGRKGDRIRASHILIQLLPSDEDMADKRGMADSLYQSILEGVDFVELARQHSDDENSRDAGGELGWYAATDLLPEFIRALTDLEIGQISPPVISDFGFHIIRLEDKREASPIDLEEDYDTLEEMARRAKAQAQLEELLAKVSAGLYVDKRL